jgi:hypothetical protein
LFVASEDEKEKSLNNTEKAQTNGWISRKTAATESSKFFQVGDVDAELKQIEKEQTESMMTDVMAGQLGFGVTQENIETIRQIIREEMAQTTGGDT